VVVRVHCRPPGNSSLGRGVTAHRLACRRGSGEQRPLEAPARRRAAAAVFLDDPGQSAQRFVGLAWAWERGGHIGLQRHYSASPGVARCANVRRRPRVPRVRGRGRVLAAGQTSDAGGPVKGAAGRIGIPPARAPRIRSGARKPSWENRRGALAHCPGVNT